MGEYLNNFLENNLNNLLVGAVIIPISIAFIVIIIQRYAKRPRLVFTSISGYSTKSSDGKTITAFGLEIENRPRFFGFPVERETARILGYDLYSPAKPGGYDVHPVWETHSGRSYDPVEIPSRQGTVISVYFLATYNETNVFYIINRINDDFTLTLSPDHIQSGTLKIKLVLRDDLGREYYFKFKPLVEKGILRVPRILPMSARISYLKASLRYLQMALNIKEKY